MIKQMIKQRALKRMGIMVNRDTAVDMNGSYRLLNEGSAFPPVVRASMLAGSIALGEGVSIDSARIFGEVVLERFANVNGPGTVIEAFLDQIRIGAFSSVAMNCLIIDSNHRTDRATSFCAQHTFFGAPYCDDLVSKGPVVLEEDVWVGSGVAIVGGGITIGRGSVIAAGAVITKDVEPYTVVAGVPGKAIGKRFSEKTIRELEDSRWFEWDIETIRANKDFFTMQRDR